MDMTEMELKWENMRRGIDGQPALLKAAPRALYEELRGALDGTTLQRLYLLGCGDSHFCGLAARYAIERWTALPTEALEALEFSRYAVRNAPKNSLAVAVSNSGRVSRTVESLRYARQHGLATLGVTYNPDGALAQEADRILKYDYRDVGFGPGTMSYLASVLALLVTGLGVAEHLGRLTPDEVDKELETIAALEPAMSETIAACEGPAEHLGNAIGEDDRVFFIGAGPNYGTALFAMAKMIEASRHNSVGQQLEEWAHEQYFCTREDTYTVVFAPLGASVGRAREQLRAVRDVGGTAVAVCAENDQTTAAMADVVFPVHGHIDELLSPLLYCVAGELIAYHFAVRKGTVMLGFDDEHRKQVNFRQIFDSEIPETIPPLGGTPS